MCNPTNILFDISYTYIHTRPYINTCICMYGSVHAQSSLLVRGGEWVNVMYVSSSTTKSAPYKNNKLSLQRPNDDISKWKKNREKRRTDVGYCISVLQRHLSFYLLFIFFYNLMCLKIMIVIYLLLFVNFEYLLRTWEHFVVCFVMFSLRLQRKLFS